LFALLRAGYTPVLPHIERYRFVVQEVADAAVWLASSKADFITGTTLNLDGGISARLHNPG
jgi:NAD(P)-dependent dehydrogenase (short-subunit alcohol dehydrogenase family)